MLNARCRLLPTSDARRGTVRYIGPVPEIPSGSSGTGGPWIGVELDEPTGKNDGSISRVGQASEGSEEKTTHPSGRYFTCKSKHGVFVRPDRLEIGSFAILDEFLDDMEEI